MGIIIEKRSRTGASQVWGDWSETNDAPPYNNTELVEYRPVSEYTIDIDQVTDNVQVNNRNEVVGDGIFDTLMETITRHVDVQFRQQRLTGENYANVYLGLTQTALSQAMDFVKQARMLEIQAENAKLESENTALKGRLLEEQIESEALKNADDGLIVTQINNAKAEVPIKVWSTELGTWASVFSNGKVDNVSTSIDADELASSLATVKGLL